MDWDRDWDGNHSLRSFVLYDFNNNNNISHFTSDDHLRPHPDAHVGILANYGNNHHLQHLHVNNDQKKKKLRVDQLDLLERSFQEDIKLDPDRKLRLSRELGLQPRQIAVWFQNRRARWKAKHLERLYDVLKLEFDAVSREKLELQEEVLRLKAMVGDAMPTEEQAVGVSEKEIAESTHRFNDEMLYCSTSADVTTNANGGPHRNHHNQLSAAVMNTFWGAGGGFPLF